ncbi:MAG: EAL domain-containing protein [Pseudomonadota bacterium]
MLMKKSLRSKLIFGIMIGCLIPYILGGLYLSRYVEDWLYEDNSRDTIRFLHQVDEYINQVMVSRFSEVVSMLSESNAVVGTDGLIRSYLNYNGGSVLEGPSPAETIISEEFKEVKGSHRDINYVFLGLESGAYMEYPELRPKSAYDPTTRPWYRNSINSEGIVISDPYISQVTEDMVVSFTKGVVLKNGQKGVLGLSVKIDSLTDSIDRIRLGNSGYILILNSNNKFTVSPVNPDWLLKTPQELNLDFIKNAEARDGQAYETKLDGEDKLIYALTSGKSQWKLYAVQPKLEVMGKSRQITNILVAIYFIMMLVVFMIIYVITKRITGPILDISKAMNRIAAYDFKFDQNSDMGKHAQREDEIGVITRALENMQDSFSELNSTVESIDREIKNIDFTRSAPAGLTLSTDNPFGHIATSFNMLLSHIQEYLQRLKDSNAEVQEKNQRLMASEEKLIAHIEEIEKQRKYINYLAYHDPLTNLPNRRKFIEFLNQALRNNRTGAVIYLDIDNFKRINETMGHVYGDKVLLGIARRLEEMVAQNAFVSRFSGDEFLIMIQSEGDIEGIRKFVAELFNMFGKPILLEGNNIEIAFSIGVSIFPHDSTDVDQLIMNADTALYEVKNTGKNGYRFFDMSMTEHLLKKSNIEQRIKEAIENDGFKLLYQPQVSLARGEVSAYEALIRFKDYPLPPAEFIPVAEENGSIIQIGRVVTEKVIEQLGIWQNKGYTLKTVSINFSALQLYDDGYLDFLKAVLSRHGVDAKYIEIEITESIFLDNKQLALEFLLELRRRGIKISIDDFGTGYSSLSYLTFLPLDKIKLDRSLNVKFLEIENLKVMDSLISLAHSLNLEVVAEGIETGEQLERLKAGKCDYVQGYYFSKPIEAEAVEENYLASVK